MISILSVDLNNINLYDFHFNEDVSETIIHVRVMAWRNRFKQRKTFKKEISKELIPVKSRDWYVPEDKKYKERTILNC